MDPLAVIPIALRVEGKLTQVAAGGFNHILIMIELAVILFARFGGGDRH